MLLAITVVGFGIAVIASQRAVDHAIMLAYSLQVPSFIIGVTLMSIGTDLPEIANSIIASLSGHGDLNVGDSIGSVATQITLVLGLLPFITSAIQIEKKRMLIVGGITVIALAIGTVFVSDGFLSRGDAFLLFFLWILATVVIVKFIPMTPEAKLNLPNKGKTFHGLMALGSLALVGFGATIGVKGIIGLAQAADIPEYLISFFGASIGTSLPELFVDVAALRSGSKDIAIGDVVGSCMVDATLSISAGPMLAPTFVTAALATKGALLAMIVVAVVSLVLALRQIHDRWSGAFLLLLYAGVYIALIA